MKVTVEQLPKSTVKLTIEVPVEECESFVKKAAERISKEVSIAGFRKGKVPYDILKQHVGEGAIYEEAFQGIVNDTYPKAVDQEKLQVAGRANIETIKLAPGNPIIFAATVPLMPKITLGNYKKIKAKKVAKAFDQKKFDRTMNDLRKMRASEKLVDRAAQKGDKALLDFQVKVDGVAIDGGSALKQMLLLEDGQMIPGFIEGVFGMKKGEEKDVNVTFPENYHKKDLQSKPAVVHFKVHDVYEVVLPELNDEFAQSLNFQSLKELELEIKQNIEKELEQESQQEFDSAVVKELLEMSKCDDLADSLVEEEVDKMVRELEYDIANQGLNFDDYLTHLKRTREEMRKDFEPKAQERLKAALVMRELAVEEKITVPGEEIEKELDELRKMYGTSPEMLARINSHGMRGNVENNLIHKALFKKLEEYTK